MLATLGVLPAFGTLVTLVTFEVSIWFDLLIPVPSVQSTDAGWFGVAGTTAGVVGGLPAMVVGLLCLMNGFGFDGLEPTLGGIEGLWSIFEK